MVLDVIRIGDSGTQAKVAFETRDGSAIEGEAYYQKAGQIIFEPGESTKSIEIEVIDNGRWNTTTEIDSRSQESPTVRALIQRLRFAVFG